MISKKIRQRLEDLEDHIAQDLILLKKYEDALRLEDEPRRLMKYEREIENIKKSTNQYQGEIESLQKEMLIEKVEEQKGLVHRLDVIASDLRLLQSGQIAILGQLNKTRQLILTHYSNTQHVAIVRALNQLNQNQMKIVEILLTSLDNNQLSQFEINQIWIAIEKRFKALPPNQAELNEIVENPKLDVKHRLKAAIPIIPLLLDYEFEFELGSEINAQRIWEYVKSKIQKNQ